MFSPFNVIAVVGRLIELVVIGGCSMGCVDDSDARKIGVFISWFVIVVGAFSIFLCFGKCIDVVHDILLCFVFTFLVLL